MCPVLVKPSIADGGKFQTCTLAGNIRFGGKFDRGVKNNFPPDGDLLFLRPQCRRKRGGKRKRGGFSILRLRRHWDPDRPTDRRFFLRPSDRTVRACDRPSNEKTLIISIFPIRPFLTARDPGIRFLLFYQNRNISVTDP